jgi:hypothetical protein
MKRGRYDKHDLTSVIIFSRQFLDPHLHRLTQFPIRINIHQVLASTERLTEHNKTDYSYLPDQFQTSYTHVLSAQLIFRFGFLVAIRSDQPRQGRVSRRSTESQENNDAVYDS